MNRWMGFLIIIFSFSIPLWASSSCEFKIKMYGCNKEKIENEDTIENLIVPIALDGIVARGVIPHVWFFCILTKGGVMYIRCDKPAQLIKIIINTREKRSFSSLIESFVGEFNPSFYTFTDPLSTN